MVGGGEDTVRSNPRFAVVLLLCCKKQTPCDTLESLTAETEGERIAVALEERKG